MNTLHTITVTSRPVPALRAQPPVTDGKQPFTRVKLRHRYRAEFTDGPFKGEWVDGFPSSDEAIGALVLCAAEKLDTAESICHFLASLFDNCKVRGANETLGRAIRFASRNPNRQNPGLTLSFIDPQNQPPKSPAPAVATAKAVRA